MHWSMVWPVLSLKDSPGAQKGERHGAIAVWRCHAETKCKWKNYECYEFCQDGKKQGYDQSIFEHISLYLFKFM